MKEQNNSQQASKSMDRHYRQQEDVNSTPVVSSSSLKSGARLVSEPIPFSTRYIQAKTSAVANITPSITEPLPVPSTPLDIRNKRIAMCEKKILELADHAKKLTKESEDLQSEAIEKDAKIATLKLQLQTMDDRFQNLTKSIKSVEDEMKILLAQFHKELKSIKEQHEKDKRKSTEQFQQKLEYVKRTISKGRASLKETLDQLKRKADELQVLNEEKDAELLSLKERCETLEKKTESETAQRNPSKIPKPMSSSSTAQTKNKSKSPTQLLPWLPRNLRLKREAAIKHLKVIQKSSTPQRYRYDCPICKKTLNRKCRIIDHLNRVHIQSELFLCKECKFRTAYKQSLNKHVSTKHPVCA